MFRDHHIQKHSPFMTASYVLLFVVMGATMYYVQLLGTTERRSKAASATSCDYTITIVSPTPTTIPVATTTASPMEQSPQSPEAPPVEETPPPVESSAPQEPILPTPTIPDVVCDRRASIVIAIDRSQSMNQVEAGGKTKLDLAKDAARAFVAAIKESGSKNIAISIVSFGGQGNDGSGRQSQSANSTLHIAASTDYDAVMNAASGLGGIQSGGTCIQCGIRIGNNQLASYADTKAFILLTDGLSNRVWNGGTSNAKAATLSEADNGRAKGIVYHVIGFGDISRKQIDDSALRAIAGSGGSYAYKPDGQTWMSGFFDLIPKFCTPVN